MRERCINRELTTEVIVGAFMMTVLLGLGYFTILLSRESWFQKRQELDIRFDTVMGLNEGDNAVCRGMPVGKVVGLRFDPDGVHVRVSLDEPVSLKEDHRFTIEATSILGGRQLSIYEGAEQADPSEPRKVYEGESPRDVMADTAELVAELKKSLFRDGLIDNLEVATRELRALSERIAAGKGTIGKLLAEDSTLYDDLAASVASLRTVVTRMESGEGTVGRLLSADDTLYNDLSETIASLKTTAARLEEGRGTIGRLMSDDDELYRDLAGAIKALRTVAERLESGEGLLGKLTSDEELASDVKGAVKELRAGIEDMRESSPVTTFTSIFFGAF
jgi:phospholipid/cholesterol/gamma-HCH transport system substrate-binding protein